MAQRTSRLAPHNSETRAARASPRALSHRRRKRVSHSRPLRRAPRLLRADFLRGLRCSILMIGIWFAQRVTGWLVHFLQECDLPSQVITAVLHDEHLSIVRKRPVVEEVAVMLGNIYPRFDKQLIAHPLQAT